MRFFVFLVLLVAIFSIGCTEDLSQYDTPENKALFAEKCSKCHSLDRATSKSHNHKEWQETIQRMRELNGARLTDLEAERVAGYLAANYRD